MKLENAKKTILVEAKNRFCSDLPFGVDEDIFDINKPQNLELELIAEIFGIDIDQYFYFRLENFASVELLKRQLK